MGLNILNRQIAQKLGLNELVLPVLSEAEVSDSQAMAVLLRQGVHKR